MRYTRIMAILIMAILFLSFSLIIGCVDKCESRYSSCMHDCGEGILSSICMEKCNYDRNQCQESGD